MPLLLSASLRAVDPRQQPSEKAARTSEKPHRGARRRPHVDHGLRPRGCGARGRQAAHAREPSSSTRRRRQRGRRHARDDGDGRAAPLRPEPPAPAVVVEEHLHLLLPDGLLLEEAVRHGVHEAPVGAQQAPAAHVGALHDALRVSRRAAAHVVGYGVPVVHVPPGPEEQAKFVLGHPVLVDHLEGQLAHALEVVRGAHGDLAPAEAELLGHATAEEHHELLEEPLPRGKAAVLVRRGVGEGREAADAVAPREDGHFAHVVVAREQGRAGVARLVEGHVGARAVVGVARAPEADLHLLQGRVHVRLADQRAVAACGADGRLVHEGGELRAGEARGLAREGAEVHGGREPLALGVHLRGVRVGSEG
mmetsp:Transcript_5632/g.19106  ORF Transcript_5632/g.19106 Transcript_5632/m.19106 type:complete len:365 (-) Transcript_5632:289-1383(-)